MAEQETPEEQEGEYIDFANFKAVDRALKKAFKEYQWPSTGAKSKSWKRKGRRLEPPVTNLGDRATTMFKLERVQKILAYSARAFPVYQIAGIVGVQERTIYGWVKRGVREGQGPFWIFAKALEQLAAAYEARLQGVVHAFTFKGGKVPTEAEADMALKQLARRFPKTWGQNVDVTSNGKTIGQGGKAAPAAVVIKFMKPGADGKPELVAPPDTEEKTVFEED